MDAEALRTFPDNDRPVELFDPAAWLIGIFEKWTEQETFDQGKVNEAFCVAHVPAFELLAAKAGFFGGNYRTQCFCASGSRCPPDLK
jgi:hypothetical protein